MTDRSTFGFLRPKERAYLSGEGYYPARIDEEPPKRPEQTKTRIKNEVVENLDEAIQTFRRDLLAASNFQRRESSINEQFVWEVTTLESSKSELEDLKSQIEGLIEQAESHPVSAEREELQEELDTLYGTADLNDTTDSARDMDPEELEELYHRRKEMNQHLNTVLSKEGLPEILSYLGENGKTDLSNRKINGEGEWWAQVATRVLVPELATKDEDTVGASKYELTEKGKAVLECWKHLQNTKTVQIKNDLRPEQTTREIVLETLAEHFPENYGC